MDEVNIRLRLRMESRLRKERLTDREGETEREGKSSGSTRLMKISGSSADIDDHESVVIEDPMDELVVMVA